MLNSEHGNSLLKILSLKGNEALTREVTDQMGTELNKCSVKCFSNGEIRIDTEESIRGCDVFIVQPASYPMNLHLVKLPIMIDACKYASAATISIVMPCYGYARQDRKARSRKPIAAKLIVNLTETAGVTRVIASDLHASQIQGFLDTPINHLVGVSIPTRHFRDDPNISPEEYVVVSSDHGSVTRACKLTGILEAPIAVIDRHRPRPSVAEVTNIVNGVGGRTAIIIDDITGTADTITLAIQALKDKGVKGVYARCIYSVLSGSAEKRIENSAIKELIVTNSIHLDEDRKPSNTEELFAASLIVQIIIRVYEKESVNILFN